VAILLAVVYGYSARTFFHAETFATRVADGLEQPELARIVAGQITDQVIAARRDLLAYRPLILGSLEKVVESQAFRAIVRKAVKESHEAVISDTGKAISLTLADVGVIVRNALAEHPEISSKLPAGALAALENPQSWPDGKILADVMRIAQRMRLRTFLLLGIGLGAGAAGLALAHPKRVFLMRGAVVLTSLAFLVGVTARFGAPLFAGLAHGELAQGLIRGLWPAFVGPLALRMWVLCGMGLVVIAGVTSTFNRVDVQSIAGFLRRITARRPGHGGLALLRAVLLVAIGGQAFFNPTMTIQVLTAAMAAVVFFLGLQEMFSLFIGWMPHATPVAANGPAGRGGLAPRIALVVVLGGVAVGAGAWWFRGQDRTPPPPPVVDACNGHPELCDRRFNEVAIATSHNSMSGGDIPNWMFPNHEKGIPAQLADGIRGFLIDVHYGVPVGDNVKTLIENEANARAKYAQALGEEGIDAAMRIRDRMVGEPTGPQDVYMAHGFCELGYTRFTDALEAMYEFLVLNPGEVIVIVIQDEGVAPQDVAACFEKSGLARLVYRGTVTPPWPTLREMVDSGQRVVVFAENDSEGVPWYHQAFEICQETPYRFLDPSEFSNQPNRGGTKGSLLLLNNWIESAPASKPSNAEIVNAYDALLKRARACRKERGMIPNLVAVDFYRSGDLLRVVDALNGVEVPAAVASR
jgi:hypothetical protein